MRCLLTAAGLVLVLATQAVADPKVWVVRDADSEMLLFGSIHVLPLDAALQQADDLWFELPVDAATGREVARLAMTTGVLPLGQSLFALLPLEDATRLLRIAETYGVDRTTLTQLKPWLAEVALAGALYQRVGAASDHGVEAAVSAAAPSAVQRRALESPSDQIALFNEASIPEQIASLRGSMDEIDSDPEAFANLIKAWIAGDISALVRETQALRDISPAQFERLIVRRNVAWTRTLDARLKGRGRTVVVVGAGHLVGDDGLPSRLRALGYSVTGP